MEIIEFCDSGGSKTLIFLRKYWCFCDVPILAKIMISSEIPENHEIIKVPSLSLELMKKSFFMKKVPDRAQGTQKGMEFHWFKQLLRLAAAQVRKSDFCAISRKSFSLISQKSEIS